MNDGGGRMEGQLMLRMNYWAVVVAGVAAFVVSSVWYAIFGNAWMELRGIDPATAADMGAPAWKMMFVVVQSLIVALMLAYFVVHLGVVDWKGAVRLGAFFAIGVWATSFSAGAAIGPLAGGVLLEFYWWGSVFLLAVPVMALLLVLGPVLLPEAPNPRIRPTRSRTERSRAASRTLWVASQRCMTTVYPGSTSRDALPTGDLTRTREHSGPGSPVEAPVRAPVCQARLRLSLVAS
jgi:MFS family permease